MRWFLTLFWAFPVMAQLSLHNPGFVASLNTPAAGGGSCDSLNDADLKVYLRLDESAGATRSDTKSANHFTDNGTVGSVAGIISNAADFDGASKYLSRADNADVSMGAHSFSIGFWLYRKATGTQGILDKTASGNEYVAFIAGATDQIKFTVTDSVSGSASVDSTETIALNTWYHVVLTYDHSDKKVRIYVNDGSATTSSGALSNQPADASSALFLGYGGGTGGFGNIRMDEFWLSKRLVTGTERTALYNSGSGCRPSGL